MHLNLLLTSIMTALHVFVSFWNGELEGIAGEAHAC